MWAPFARSCELHIVAPEDRYVRMEAAGGGHFAVELEVCAPGTRYFFRLNGDAERPDPASRSQPDGVHGASEVVAPDALSTAGWRGINIRDYVIYELHVGTFTAEGTFDAAIGCLDRLRDLGVTAIEIMPVAQFPGERNWGYDGVYPYAAQNSYGGVAGLRRLVAACHERGMAAVLDVVYNHLGPEGNYLRDFGPYFTDRYKTPWGEAINFDGPGSDGVREFFIDNALYWLETVGFDALRLDAVHAIYDRSAYPFLQELADAVRALRARSGRRVYLIAESDLNDARLIRDCGLDAQWADDFHHCLHTLLTGERRGYYGDFGGTVEELAKTLRDGWFYSGQYARTRDRRYGNSAAALTGEELVVCTNNHDQAGNRMLGERLEHLAGSEAAKVAAAAMILSPYLPLLFMGEEYAEPAPFLYFVDHSDAALKEAVRKGRAAEFAEFQDAGGPPDPQDVETFRRSKLNQALVSQAGPHGAMYAWYRRLLELRRTHPALQSRDKTAMQVEARGDTLLMRRRGAGEEALVVLHFGASATAVELPAGEWHKVAESAAAEGGRVAPMSCTVYSSTRQG